MPRARLTLRFHRTTARIPRDTGVQDPTRLGYPGHAPPQNAVRPQENPRDRPCEDRAVVNSSRALCTACPYEFAFSQCSTVRDVSGSHRASSSRMTAGKSPGRGGKHCDPDAIHRSRPRARRGPDGRSRRPQSGARRVRTILQLSPSHASQTGHANRPAGVRPAPDRSLCAPPSPTLQPNVTNSTWVSSR